jgi:protein-tyrosine phosphatase
MVKNLLLVLSMCLAAPPSPAGDPPRRVLFICTGNYFRSAFAEHYFNFLSARNQKLGAGDPLRKKVPWLAESRGMDLSQLSSSQRAARMSRYTVERLRKLGVPVPEEPRSRLPLHTPTLLSLQDLERFDRVIAMHDPSHRPMLRRFIAHHQAQGQVKDPRTLEDRVTYWNIEDVTLAPVIPLTPRQQADRSLDQLQKEVEALFGAL